MEGRVTSIVASGTLNLAALIVPGVYIAIVPPQLIFGGVPTNRIGVVGTASWGPVGTPVIVGNMPAQVAAFGTPVARKYDMGTHVATAIQQGATDFRCVRVSDGTDTAAQVVVGSTNITFTAAFTGSLGNNLTVQLLAGSKTGTWKAVVSVPGGVPEIFDNISGSGNAFWVNLTAAINTGTGVARGIPSALIIATAGSGTTTPTLATYSLSSGTDGTSGIAAAALVGVDTALRTGMYALRNTGASLLVLADMDTYTLWSTVDGFAQSEAMEAIQTSASGDTVVNCIANKASAGLDSWSSKLMLGDFIYWADPFAKVQRWVGPQGFVAGRYASLSPEQSGLNKILYGVGATQKSGSGLGQALSYSSAELTALIQAGIDVIGNPGAGGIPIWTMQVGHNASSNASISGDNYTRLTNFIASSLSSGMAPYLGMPINPKFAHQVSVSLSDFFLNLIGAGILAMQFDGTLPYSVDCRLGPGTPNPQSQTALGIFVANVQVQYQAIAEKLVINLEGGQTVTIARSVLPNGIIAPGN